GSRTLEPPLLCRTLPQLPDPGQGVEPRSPRSERGVLPVRRSRNARAASASGARRSVEKLPDGKTTGRSRASPSIPRSEEIDAAGERRLSAMVASSVSSGPRPNDVFYATRPPFDPGSPAAGCAHSQRSTFYVEGFWSPTSGPDLENSTLKHTLIASAYFQRRALRVFLSRTGPRFDLELVQAEHHLWFRC